MTTAEEWIYRAMLDDNGMPRRGALALTLGIRPGYDIEVDESGRVHRPSFRPGDKNGLSCSPTIKSLPTFVRPRKFGGNNKKTTVWRICKDDLPSKLVAQEDQENHISIGPAGDMSISEFMAAIEDTVPLWEKVE
jgi:hypothetical protein